MLIFFVFFAVLVFLSTPSARRATQCMINLVQLLQFLSTPSARRATVRTRYAPRPGKISIHALREEGDGAAPSITPFSVLFLSTPSARRATELKPKQRNK